MRLGRARIAVLATCVVAASACGDAGRSPLIPLAPVTRLRVHQRGASPHEHEIIDRRILDSVVRFVVTTSGWEKSWHTLPSGEYLVALRHDTSMVGRFWFGSNFVVASGVTPAQRGARIRSTSKEEIGRLRAWLDLDRYDSSEDACGAFAQQVYDRLYGYKDMYPDQNEDVATRLLALQPSVVAPQLRRMLTADVAAQTHSAGEIVSVTGDLDPLSASRDPAFGYFASANDLRRERRGLFCPVRLTPLLATPTKGPGVDWLWLLFGADGWQIAEVSYRDGTTLIGLLQRGEKARSHSSPARKAAK